MSYLTTRCGDGQGAPPVAGIPTKPGARPPAFADLLVLSDDCLTVEAGQINDVSPVMTLVGGRIVHADPDAGL
ncbi:MAG: hypothetical protein OXC14_05930 [Rhodospirillaceae bacterium]|nr:hypothetical protein [Rhodospirillaceae bacterium]